MHVVDLKPDEAAICAEAIKKQMKVVDGQISQAEGMGVDAAVIAYTKHKGRLEALVRKLTGEQTLID